ncbi:MAG: hypothetical protein IJH00_03740 [Erysipelotrichaceae bacterium]|nr:hypothetical protein [Erysipelotrichaceae bacterium]
MKKLFIVIFILFILCSCEKKNDDITPSIKDDDPIVNYSRYFVYQGGESLKGDGELVVPQVFYNGNSYDYPFFLEAFRFARYIKVDGNGKGISVNVDFTEQSAEDINGKSFSLPVFDVKEEECEIYFNDNAAKIGDQFYSCFIEDGILHLEYELFKEVSGEDIDGILNGTTGFKELSDLEIGDYAALGRLEQDNCKENGADPIYWKVIDKQDDRILLLSDNVIDSFRFNEEGNTNWVDSSLREYLNGIFFDSVFTNEEKKLIVTSHLENRSYSDYLKEYFIRPNSYIDYDSLENVDNGSDSDDKVFVLDLGEVISYLGEEDDYYPSFMDEDNGPKQWSETWNRFGIDLSYGASGRLCRPSDQLTRYSTVGFSTYHQSSTRHYANYWTRTMGDRQNRAIVITDIGAFMSFDVSADNVGVRPAMWIVTR